MSRFFLRLETLSRKYAIYCLSLLFLLLYSILSVTRHNHFMSAWDLSVVDQIMWKYSRFLPPVTTIHDYVNTLIFTDHIEFIYAILSPIYWIWNDARALIIAQAFFISTSVIPIYLFAIKRNINYIIALSISLCYLLFYGIQTAVWNDVHSIVFGAAILAWFIYFLESKKTKLIVFSFLLAIFCKEDVAFLTFFISLVYFLLRKDRQTIALMISSAVYLFLVFGIYYPHFTSGYRFENANGALSNLNLNSYWNSLPKRQTLFFSLAGFGFLPLLSPLFLIPGFADISHYFILGQTVVTAQGIALHYRVTLAPLLSLPTIVLVSKFKRLNGWKTGVYLVICSLAIFYYLHLPLTYLTKSWFWHEPESVKSINKVIKFLPANASVVSEVNIIPHIAHRKEIYTLWADQETFKSTSPCKKTTCPWFRWDGNPEFLIADTSTDWDIRQLFQNNPDFNSALESMQKEKVIKVYKKMGTAILFRVIKNPKNI